MPSRLRYCGGRLGVITDRSLLVYPAEPVTAVPYSAYTMYLSQVFARAAVGPCLPLCAQRVGVVACKGARPASSSPDHHYDMIISGGGLVGFAMACALGKLPCYNHLFSGVSCASKSSGEFFSDMTALTIIKFIEKCS